jgi:TrmH family RNA methyltransferase
MLTKAQLKSLRALKQKRGRIAQEKYLIEGVHLCREALGSKAKLDLILYTSAGFQNIEIKQVVVTAQKQGIPNLRIPPSELKSLADAVAPQGLVAVVNRLQPETGPYRGRIMLLLDQVRDPGNVGTIIRTADASGADAVFLTGESADPYSPKVLRATQGSIFHLPLYHHVDPEKLIADLKTRGFRVFVADPRAHRSHTQVRFPHRFLLVVGNETKGVRPELKTRGDDLIGVPIVGQAESLNVSMAAGVILYEALRQRTAKGKSDVAKKRNFRRFK